MTTHCLHVRLLVASVTMVAASVAEFVLSRFSGSVHYLAAVPIVAVAVCGVVIARTTVAIERGMSAAAARSCDCSKGGRQGHSRNGGALLDKQAITTTVVTSNIT